MSSEEMSFDNVHGRTTDACLYYKLTYERWAITGGLTMGYYAHIFTLDSIIVLNVHENSTCMENLNPLSLASHFCDVDKQGSLY